MRRRNIAWILLLTTLGVVLALMFGRVLLVRSLRPFVISQLASRLKAKVTLEDLELSFFPPSLEITGLSVKPNEGPLRFLGVTRGLARLSAMPIFLGKIVVENIEIDTPVLRVDLTGEPNEEAPKPKKFPFLEIPTLKDLIRIDVRKAAIHAARLTVRLPVRDIQVHVDSGEVSYEGKGKKERWMWNGRGELRRQGEVVPVDRVTIAAEREGNHVTLKQFDVLGAGIDAHLSGEAYPEANLTGTLSSDLIPLEELLLSLKVLNSPLHLGGAADIYVKAQGPWRSLKWSGKIGLQSLAVAKRKFDRVDLSFRVRNQLVEKLSGEIRLGGAPINFSVRGLRAGVAADYSIAAQAVPYEALQLAIDPENIPKLHGPVSINVTGQVGFQPSQLRGKYEISVPKLVLELPPEVEPYLPLDFKNVLVTGNLGYQQDRGVFLESGQVGAGGLKGKYQFDFLKDGQVRGTWDATIDQVRALFREGNDSRGQGHVGGGIEAKHKQFRAVLDLKLDGLGAGDKGGTRFDGQIIFEKGVTRLKQFYMRSGQSSVRFDADFPFDVPEPTRIKALWKDMDFGFIAQVARRRYPFLTELEGVSSGSIDFQGETAELSGSLRTTVAPLTWHGKPFDSLEGLLDLERGALIFQKVELKGPQGEATLHGAVRDGELKDLTVVATNLPIEIVSLPKWLAKLASRVSGEVVLNGASSNPMLEGKADFLKEDEKIYATARASGNLSELKWNLGADQDRFQADGSLGLVKERTISARGRFEDHSVDLAFAPGTSKASGQFQFSGNLDSFATWDGELNLQKFSVRQSDVDISTVEPAVVTLKAGDLVLSPVTVIGPGSEFRLRASLDHQQRLEGEAVGKVGLSVLSLLPLRVQRAEGSADVNVKMDGTLSSPRFQGTATAHGGFLQFQKFPHALEDLEFKATIDQQRITFDDVVARVSEGQVHARGQLILGATLAQSSVTATGTAERVNWRFPPWLPASLSGTLSLVGPLMRPVLRGDVLVHEMTYRDDWDWKSRVLTFGRAGRRVRTYRTDEEHLGLDIRLRTDGDHIFIKNNIATGTLRADLRLVGSDLVMGLLGRLDVVEGKVSFLDNQFVLSTGVVTFESDHDFKPVFDLQARTRVQDTDILLDIRTQKDEVLAFLSSQPAKDETNILSLLTLGVDTNELIQSGGNQQNLGTAVIPSVLSTPIQGNLEAGLRRAKIIDTFQFLPFWSEDTKAPGLKMILGKQLVPKLRLTYSTDLLNTSADNTVKLEQQFTRNVSLQGSLRDNSQQTQKSAVDLGTEFGLGLDFEFFFDF